MKTAAKERLKRTPLTEVDWQIFRLGFFAMGALVLLFAFGWLFGERGVHVAPESTRTTQALNGS